MAGSALEDEEPFYDLDTSDSKETCQPAACSSLLSIRRSAALNPDAAPFSPTVGSRPTARLERGQDPLHSMDDDLWELLDSP
jgi:hypothetical protein